MRVLEEKFQRELRKLELIGHWWFLLACKELREIERGFNKRSS